MSEQNTIERADAAESHVFSLADRLRPADFTEFVGQSHLFADDAPLATAIKDGELASAVLLGPRGAGKRTLAELMAAAVDWPSFVVDGSAATIGDIRNVFTAAMHARREGAPGALVVVADADGLSLAAQDALLLCADEGGVVFLATAVNTDTVRPDTMPLARIPVHEFEPLDNDDVAIVVERALADSERGLGGRRIEFDAAVRARIVNESHGRIRWALNQIEDLVARFDAAAPESDVVTPEMVERLYSEPVDDDVVEAPVIDSQDDESAAEPDGASIETTAEAEQFSVPEDVIVDTDDVPTDPVDDLRDCIRASRFADVRSCVRGALAADYSIDALGRVLLRMASEEIGNQDPGALRVVLDACDAAARLGVVDGEPALTQAAEYLAKAPKLDVS